MATDDQSEKSLFARIRDCVLAELNRKSEIRRAPCPSRKNWGWPIVRDSIGGESRKAESKEDDKSATGKAGSSTGGESHKTENEDDKSATRKAGSESSKNEHVTSKEEGMMGVKDNCPEFGSTKSSDGSETSGQKDARGTEKNISGAEPNLSKPAKVGPRRYYIKMQNPEAPPCCESLNLRQTSPPNSSKSKASNEDKEKYNKPPICRCSDSASVNNN